MNVEIQHLRAPVLVREMNQETGEIAKGSVKIQADPEPCRTSPGNVHVQTHKGTWCIPGCVTVYVPFKS